MRFNRRWDAAARHVPPERGRARTGRCWKLRKRGTGMHRLTGVATAIVVSLSACTEPINAPSTGGLSLRIIASPGSIAALDSGHVIVASGTSIKAMKKASPGQTVTFDGLATGSYVVALEGFLADAVQYYGQTSVQVEAGKNNSAAVTFTSFQPALNPQDVARGATVTLDGRGGRTET